ncbi:MAG: hypothetical protein E7443_01560 [Ruminococcaceae bacterium]|nr:hypothetical protein [Oscillospiraceae bacterium]
MRKHSLGTKLWAAGMSLLVVGYFAIQAYRYFNDPFSTTLAYSYQVEEGATLSGWVTRDEQLLPASGDGIVELRREEGERVGTGGTVAEIYASRDAKDIHTQIEAIDAQIEQLRYAQETLASPEAALKLDAQIEQSILDYRRYVTAGQLSKSETEGRELRALVMKRDFSASESEDFESRIQQLESRAKELKKQATGSVRTINAPRSGLYSAAVDGYESVLRPESLSALTPAGLEALRAENSTGAELGKLILGDRWYYSVVMTMEEAKEVSERSAALEKQQQTLTLRFAKSVERDLPVTVAFVGPEEDGKCVVTFCGSTYLPQLTLLRRQSAQLVTRTYEGIRVPKSALRMVTMKKTAEDGTEKTVQVTGLYCVVGMEARFKPVEILYSGDGFVLVRAAAPAGNETLKLRPGDEVIVLARDLYDGKVLG